MAKFILCSFSFHFWLRDTGSHSQSWTMPESQSWWGWLVLCLCKGLRKLRMKHDPAIPQILCSSYLHCCIGCGSFFENKAKAKAAENFWQEWSRSDWAWCVCWYVFRAGCVRGWPALFPLPALTAAGKQMFTTVINAFYSCILSKVEICCDMGSARTCCGFSRHNININIFQQLITSDMNGAWFSSVARATLHDTWPSLLYYFFYSARKTINHHCQLSNICFKEQDIKIILITSSAFMPEKLQEGNKLKMIYIYSTSETTLST